MGAGLIFFLASILCYVALSSCRIWEIPLPDSLQNCYSRANSANLDRYVGSVYSWLCENSLMNSTYDTRPIPRKTIEYVTQLHDIALTTGATSNRSKRQADKRCVRKEYRRLTFEERRRYHDAVNALKRDTSIRPNKYDAIASIHTGATNYKAYGGPGFLGWHRIYLLIYETALRQVDPRVCLPYWDSTLDSQLQDPFLSSIWNPEFLGTPRGKVVDGPFANWVLPNGGQLIRNVGVDGDVLTTDIVNEILTRTSYDEIITSDTVDPRYELELHHGAVLMFVGGAMTRLDTAAFDPVFFMHHAFMDYIWERFRSKLRSINVDPAIYPSTYNLWHLGDASMGFSNRTQASGYSEDIANRVTYEPIPTCSLLSPSCGERYVNQLHDIALENTSGATSNQSKRQADKPCVRKEYRMLTLEERKRYHDAVNALKRDTSVKPNRYDAIAIIRSGNASTSGHAGPGFLGWNRMYLLTYETALRQVDPRVCLPYWDSTLDSELQDPFMSSIWTPEFLGTPRGVVVDGPFAKWRLPNGGQLIRNVGIDGDVLTNDVVKDILSRTSYDQIVTSDNVDLRYSIELHQGTVHMFVGGAMNSPKTASFDPVFFMHYAFIDYIWERFRSKLRSIKVNPEIYPSTDTCNKPTTYALPHQNDYCVGPSCDTDKWVIIPVKIISVRPPKLRKYYSYPVKKGRIDDTLDIYAPNVNDDTNKFIYSRQGKLKTYARCQEDSAVGQIFLYSQGINYPGYYKESTIVDQKLTVSVSLGFIGVKKPSEVEGGVSRALLRAHDSCGRVCQVVCRDADSKNYTVCSGAVAVDDTTPRMYGRNFDEAVMSIGDYSMDNGVPEFKVDNLYIAFYCDYSGDVPFAVRKN